MFYLTIKRIHKNYLVRRLTIARLFFGLLSKDRACMEECFIIEGFNINLKYHRETSEHNRGQDVIKK